MNGKLKGNSSDENYQKAEDNLWFQLIGKLVFLSSIFLVGVIFALAWQALKSPIHKYKTRIKYDQAYFEEAVRNRVSAAAADPERIVEGIHMGTGMKAGKGFAITRAACTGCHSPKLITQNRATREGWEQMIHWMQATQGLPDLGKNESAILDYLALNYAPEAIGRRANLDMESIDWYDLKLKD